MKFDSSQITVVIAIAAIISPVIVAVVNDIFTYKLKKQEFELNNEKLQKEQEFQQHKLDIESQNKIRELVSDFVASANHYYHAILIEDLGLIDKSQDEFANANAQLLVKLPPQKQKLMLSWLNKSHSNNPNEWYELITEINSEAPKLLKSINYQRRNKSNQDQI